MYIIVKRDNLLEKMVPVAPFRIVEIPGNEARFIRTERTPDSLLILKNSYSTISVKNIVDYSDDLQKLQNQNLDKSMYFI